MRLLVRLVKGDTTLASASLSAMPACAARRAPQSLPPSPHMATTSPASIRRCTMLCFVSGAVRAKIRTFSTSLRSAASSCTASASYAAPVIASSTKRFTWRLRLSSSAVVHGGPARSPPPATTPPPAADASLCSGEDTPSSSAELPDDNRSRPSTVSASGPPTRRQSTFPSTASASITWTPSWTMDTRRAT